MTDYITYSSCAVSYLFIQLQEGCFSNSTLYYLQVSSFHGIPIKSHIRIAHPRSSAAVPICRPRRAALFVLLLYLVAPRLFLFLIFKYFATLFTLFTFKISFSQCLPDIQILILSLTSSAVCLSVRLPACMLNCSLSIALITCVHSLATCLFVCLFACLSHLYLNIFLSVLFYVGLPVVSLSGYVLSCLFEYLSSCLFVCLLVYQFCNT